MGEGDHPRQARGVDREEGDQGRGEHRVGLAVPAALGGGARDHRHQRVAQDVAERGEGPADVVLGEDRGARDAQRGVEGDRQEGAARAAEGAHAECAERAQRDGDGREGQGDGEAGHQGEDQGARNDQDGLAGQGAAEAIGEDAVAAQGGGRGCSGHGTSLNN